MTDEAKDEAKDRESTMRPWVKLGMFLAYQGMARTALRSAVAEAPCRASRELLIEQAEEANKMATVAMESAIQAMEEPDAHE